MTEKDKLFVYDTKLKQLKEEAESILVLLRKIRRQLKQFEVEELQVFSETFDFKNASGSDSEESTSGDKNLLLEVIDCAEIVNANTLELDLKKAFDDETEESEESDDSD